MSFLAKAGLAAERSFFLYNLLKQPNAFEQALKIVASASPLFTCETFDGEH